MGNTGQLAFEAHGDLICPREGQKMVSSQPVLKINLYCGQCWSYWNRPLAAIRPAFKMSTCAL